MKPASLGEPTRPSSVALVALPPMASRYEALTAFLAERSDPVVEMTFSELDRLVGGLPDSARKHPAWWSNSRSSQPQARFWLDAKRRATPDFNAGRVRFTFGAEAQSYRRDVVAGRKEAILTATDDVIAVEVRFAWLHAGAVTLDTLGKLTFIRLPSRPGVYRFTLVPDDAGLAGVYIGESDNLARRMGNYRNSGSTQPTNQRMHARMHEVLTAGGSVSVSVALEVTVDGETVDLGTRPARLFAENAALLRAIQLGQHVENL